MLDRGCRIKKVKWNWRRSSSGTTVGFPGSDAVAYGYGGPALSSRSLGVADPSVEGVSVDGVPTPRL